MGRQRCKAPLPRPHSGEGAPPIDAEALQETAKPVAPARPSWAGVKTHLGQWGQHLVRALASSQEPQILQKRDRQGQSYFQVYDPVSQSHHRFATEADLRTWLDQRYYQ